jgi:hypothetical protein
MLAEAWLSGFAPRFIGRSGEPNRDETPPIYRKPEAIGARSGTRAACNGFLSARGKGHAEQT